MVDQNVEQNVSFYFLSKSSCGIALRSLDKNFCCVILMQEIIDFYIHELYETHAL